MKFNIIFFLVVVSLVFGSLPVVIGKPVLDISKDDFFLLGYREKADVDANHTLKIGYDKDILLVDSDISYRIIGSPSDIKVFNSCVDIRLVVRDDNFEFVGSVNRWGVYNVDIQPVVKGLNLHGVNGIGSWWNSSWGFMKVLNVSTPINWYQMRIDISKNAGFGNVNCSGNCEDDFEDIRFVDIDNTTMFDYWIEGYINGNATFWVKLGNDIETDSNFLMYYGNAAANNISNGDDTFVFYDNFSGISMDASKWDVEIGATVDFSTEGLVSLSDDGIIVTDNNYPINIRTRCRLVSDEQDFNSILFNYGGNGSIDNTNRILLGSSDGIHPDEFDAFYYITEENDVMNKTDDNGHADFRSYCTYEMTWVADVVNWYQNDSLIEQHINNIIDNNAYLRFKVFDTSQESTSTYDWVFIGNYTPNEPYIVGTSGEQEQPEPGGPNPVLVFLGGNGSACPCCINFCFVCYNSTDGFLNLSRYVDGVVVFGVSISVVNNETVCFHWNNFTYLLYNYTYYFNATLEVNGSVSYSNFSVATDILSNCSYLGSGDDMNVTLGVEAGSFLGIMILLLLIGYFIHKINYKYVGVHLPLGILAVFLVLINYLTIQAWFDHSLTVMVVFAVMLLIFAGYKDWHGASV